MHHQPTSMPVARGQRGQALAGRRHEDERKSGEHLDVVVVYPDPHDLPYEMLGEGLGMHDAQHVFAVVALVRDVSEAGLGIRVEGQGIMASNVLRPGQRCVLKLTVTASVVPREVARFVRADEYGNFAFVLLKARARWHHRAPRHEEMPDRITAGFELLDSNPLPVLDFVKDLFDLGY